MHAQVCQIVFMQDISNMSSEATNGGKLVHM